MSDTYEVRFQLADGSVRTVQVFTGGPRKAELRGREELVRIVPAEAYTATVVSVKVVPAPDPG